jgi:hypothetical protein
MKTNWRIFVGIILVLFGGLALAQTQGWLVMEGSMWATLTGALFGVIGLGFLYVLISDRNNWWAAIPGVTLLGLSATVLVPSFAPGMGRYMGGVFLGSIAVAFWVVFAMRRDYWWAIIPAGTLTTLALVAGIPSIKGFDVGALFFLGLALTFGALGLVQVNGKRMTWPFIPGGIMLLMGLLIGFSASSFIGYLWPAVLILGGVVIVWRAMRKAS